MNKCYISSSSINNNNNNNNNNDNNNNKMGAKMRLAFLLFLF